VVDCSGLTDSEGKPTSGYDPSNEIDFLEEEIDLWFADVINRTIEKIKASLVKLSKDELTNVLYQQLSGLEVGKNDIRKTLEKFPIIDVKNFAKELRKLSKPIIFAANKIDLKEAQQNFEKLKEKYQNVIPTSADVEIALKRASEKSLINYLPGNGFEIPNPEKLESSQLNALKFIKNDLIEKYGSTGVQTCLNKAVFEFLDYIAIYPVADIHKFSDKDSNALPDVFLVPRGTTMKEFAFKVHTDIGEKFICGIDARTKMKLSSDHELKNKDVVQIAFSK
jgi:hypothetical protein